MLVCAVGLEGTEVPVRRRRHGLVLLGDCEGHGEEAAAKKEVMYK